MAVSQSDFQSACSQLRSQWQQHDSSGKWQDVRVMNDLGCSWLRITRAVHSESFHSSTQSGGPAETTGAAIEEDDTEVLHPQRRLLKRPLVVYDVVHSPSYQVPVLYITFKDMSTLSRGLPPPDQVYEMLVPTLYRRQIDAVGPMGALSMTDHPITSTPAYFIHPCRTVEAMEAVTEISRTTPEIYLLRWIGMIGQSVGLEVPRELAQAFEPVNGKS